MTKLLFIAFLLVPLGEIYVLLSVGSLIGVLATVGMVVLTAVTGAGLIRVQGLATLARLRRILDQGQLPAMELLEAACLLIAGALLLTPGFITDGFGFLLLIPVLRRGMIRALLKRGVLRAKFKADPASQTTETGRTIEGEYTRNDP